MMLAHDRCGVQGSTNVQAFDQQVEHPATNASVGAAAVVGAQGLLSFNTEVACEGKLLIAETTVA